MGFLFKGPEDTYAALHVEFNPGATKAGGRAKYFGERSFSEQLHEYRKEKSIEEYPTATKKQIEFACRTLGAKERDILDALGLPAKLKEWQSENHKIEIMFWEDMANGKHPKGTLSPEQLFEMSFWEAVRAPKSQSQNKQDASISESQDVDSRVADASTLIDSGSQKTSDGVPLSSVNKAEIIKTIQSYSSSPPSQEKSFSSGDESTTAATKLSLNKRTSRDNQRTVKYVIGVLIIVATTFGGWRYMSGPSVISDVKNLTLNEFEALNERGNKYNNELEAASNQFIDWVSKNAQFFLAHSPLSADEITRKQTEDLTVVTSKNREEIQNLLKIRKDFFEYRRNLLKKYQPLTIATLEIAEVGLNYEKDIIENYQMLADGKISFGAFNQKRLKITNQINTETDKIAQKYKIN